LFKQAGDEVELGETRWMIHRMLRSIYFKLYIYSLVLTRHFRTARHSVTSERGTVTVTP
jgi:hypothetical protein